MRHILTLLVALIALNCMACSTIGKVLDFAGPTVVNETWYIKDGQQQQFAKDEKECRYLATGWPHADEKMDACLQARGYRLEITRN